MSPTDFSYLHVCLSVGNWLYMNIRLFFLVISKSDSLTNMFLYFSHHFAPLNNKNFIYLLLTSLLSHPLDIDYLLSCACSIILGPASPKASNHIDNSLINIMEAIATGAIMLRYLYSKYFINTLWADTLLFTIYRYNINALYCYL